MELLPPYFNTKHNLIKNCIKNSFLTLRYTFDDFFLYRFLEIHETQFNIKFYEDRKADVRNSIKNSFFLPHLFLRRLLDILIIDHLLEMYETSRRIYHSRDNDANGGIKTERFIGSRSWCTLGAFSRKP